MGACAVCGCSVGGNPHKALEVVTERESACLDRGDQPGTIRDRRLPERDPKAESLKREHRHV